MTLTTLDYTIIIGFFLISLLIGVWASKSAGKSSADFFLSGRNMPWWLLGVSMVATTFAADTPGLVTELVRKNGVSGNWVWWAMLLTGMLTVFFYAKLWRKSGITTDLEFYELRYSGKMAGFLRGFRAIYLGVIFNIIAMAGVCLAGAKIANILLGISQGEMLIYSSIIVVIYSSLGGLKGVLLTDFVQFILAMIGSVWATVYIVNMPEINGLSNLLSHPNVSGKLNMLPDFSNTESLITLFIIPFAVQWWSTWYPGAEPGGGGYIAQRMLAAKDEKNATWATLFFNFAHYALRPWPWIIVGLASLIIFPSLESMNQAFPNLSEEMQGHDVGYAAMMTYLPAGLLGIVLTSLIAAFMSTISTQLNWGSSYIVNDFYSRFINKEASEKQKVVVGRISTVLLMICAALFSFYLQSAKDVFDLLLQIGAGTGLLFILRWFWSRINPYSEIAAMGISFVIAFFFFINRKLENPFFEIAGYWQLIIGVVITTFGWILVTLLTKPTDKKTIDNFESLIFEGEDKFKNIGMKIVGFITGTIGVYSFLFATGNWIYGKTLLA
ncbi:Na+:solute symporter [Tenacibaculum finnmarkense genomovar finnmarkense]|uniref:sodium:solute symporter family protein n=1 Tax=Tenacibaculum finnmarkense TaxID=2781243 RepID=UPI00293ED936|nr:sodium:solute symporter family protein [Tenacibaculum finnmarkense]MCG8186856.1 Na+:solute symporter [Tenacibaculum finnmarkense genomovar finnmarkense]MCG8203370.1 Na+:solute symporter [Tenacibaculum finnmarkense genomovar finnmarkense]MCG8210818.1 Na+:solute symporter [Tenacibaculum finnmarkense genomovar finnmarkense]MCG8213642.1 Na+:solute symporter [Tenacibaculum finnmarkense genomovar finnmarkense]MCG8220968.1 Na+:solute symporter [Tenacibaculum finnmarkense genomovar finnmarkense]